MTTIKTHMDLDYGKIKLNVIANLFRMLVDIYGSKKGKEKLKKVEGEEIVVSFPALNGSIVLKPHAGRVLGEVGESDSAIATITIKVDEKKLFDVVEDIVRSSQRWGILKILFKYVLTRKIKLSGSKRASINTFKSLMIGDHEMYKKAKKQAHIQKES